MINPKWTIPSFLKNIDVFGVSFLDVDFRRMTVTQVVPGKAGLMRGYVPPCDRFIRGVTVLFKVQDDGDYIQFAFPSTEADKRLFSREL